MKVLFCDPLNTQNSFYTYAKYLRPKGVDAVVVIDSGSDFSSGVPREHRPEWHDPAHSQADQEWVKYLELPNFIPFRNPAEYLRRLHHLVSYANQFDLIACSSVAPIWMQHSKRPFIFFSYGSDLDQLAVQGWSGAPNQRFSMTDRALQPIIKHSLVAALRKAKAAIVAPYQIGTAETVGLHNIRFLPHLIDTNLFYIEDNEERQRHSQELHNRLQCDFVAFHPTRQAWVDVTQADCKGNDKVFSAFAAFVRKYDKRAKLLVVRKGWDLDASYKLAQELGIENHVVWMDPVNKAEMRCLYNSVDVTLDQFVVGVLTLVTLESLACGTPAITYVAKAPAGMFYPVLPPITNAQTISDILSSLLGIARRADSPELQNRLAVVGREWVMHNCSPDVSMDAFIKLFEEVLGEPKEGKQ